MAWDDIELSQKIELFEVRNSVGKVRQPEWANHLDSLEGVLNQKVYNSRGKLIQTPYEDFCKELFENFCKCEKDFEIGGNWHDAEFYDSDYFYRIETLSSFLRKHSSLFSTYSDTAKALDINPLFQTKEVIFKSIFDTYMVEKDWLSLNTFVTRFHSPRNISWWSNDFNFESSTMMPKEMAGDRLSYKHKWILDFAFKVGLSSDWLTDDLLFLRLESAKIESENIKMPSVIDAYAQPIFSPQLNVKPKYGKAFDLVNDIKPITREFVVKNIPINAITFIPVRINERELNEINPKPRLTKALVEQLIKNI